MPKKGKGKGKKGKKGKKGAGAPDPLVLPIDILQAATIRCDIEAVEAWLNGGGKVDAVHGNPLYGDRGRTLLMIAARNGQEMFCESLLARRGAVNRQDSNGTTPLMFAATQGHHFVVRKLLWGGALPGIRNTLGQTALAWAQEKGHAETIKVLTEYMESHPELEMPAPWITPAATVGVTPLNSGGIWAGI